MACRGGRGHFGAGVPLTWCSQQDPNSSGGKEETSWCVEQEQQEVSCEWLPESAGRGGSENLLGKKGFKGESPGRQCLVNRAQKNPTIGPEAGRMEKDKGENPAVA